MQVDKCSVVPDLKAKIQTENIEKRVIAPSVNSKDTFIKKVDPHKAVIAGSTAVAGLEAGKKIGAKLASGIDSQLDEIARDFCKTPRKLMPDKVKSVIKWGSGSLCAFYAATLILTDKNQNGELDIIEAVKNLLDPR